MTVMRWVELIANGMLAVTAVELLLFVWLFSRTAWHKSDIGRALMALMVVLGLIMTLAVGGRAWREIVGPLPEWWPVTGLVCFTAMAIAMGRQPWLIVKHRAAADAARDGGWRAPAPADRPDESEEIAVNWLAARKKGFIALGAALLVVLTGLVTPDSGGVAALADNHLSTGEAVIAVSAFGTALLVYFQANTPGAQYAKWTAAIIGAVAALPLAVFTGPLEISELVQITVALGAALMVRTVANSGVTLARSDTGEGQRTAYR